MKIYFSSSLRAKKLYQKEFLAIYNIIADLGYKHTSDFVVKANPDQFYQRSSGEFITFYKTLFKQIKKADVCVFEVSWHSLGVGYSINLALDMDKPVILLHKSDQQPVFFKGIKKGKLQIHKYDDENLKEVLKDSLEEAKQMIDIRFTFFVTPEINRFLTWVAKHKKIPRAVYLRHQLEAAMKEEHFKD